MYDIIQKMRKIISRHTLSLIKSFLLLNIKTKTKIKPISQSL